MPVLKNHNTETGYQNEQANAMKSRMLASYLKHTTLQPCQDSWVFPSDRPFYHTVHTLDSSWSVLNATNSSSSSSLQIKLVQNAELQRKTQNSFQRSVPSAFLPNQEMFWEEHTHKALQLSFSSGTFIPHPGCFLLDSRWRAKLKSGERINRLENAEIIFYFQNRNFWKLL